MFCFFQMFPLKMNSKSEKHLSLNVNENLSSQRGIRPVGMGAFSIFSIFQCLPQRQDFNVFHPL